MKQRIRAIVAIDENGRYAIYGGTNDGETEHRENAVKAVETPLYSAKSYDGPIHIYIIEAEVETPLSRFEGAARLVSVSPDPEDG